MFPDTPWAFGVREFSSGEEVCELKKLFFFPEFFTTPHYPGPISHCSLLFKLPVNFFKFIYAKERHHLICSIIFIPGFWKQFRDHKNVTCCNKQKCSVCIVIASRIIVWWAFGAQALERGFAAFFVAGHLQVGLAPSSSGVASSYTHPWRGSGSPDPGQGWSEAKVKKLPTLRDFVSGFWVFYVKVASLRRRAGSPAHQPRLRRFHVPNTSFFISFVLLLACLTTQFLISLIIQLAGVL